MLKHLTLLTCCAALFAACELNLEKLKDEDPVDKPDIGEKITPQELPLLEGHYISPAARLSIHSDQTFTMESENTVTWNQTVSGKKTASSSAVCTVAYRGSLEAYKNKAGKYLNLHVDGADVIDVGELSTSKPNLSPNDICRSYTDSLERHDAVQVRYTVDGNTLHLTQDVRFASASTESYTVSGENKMFGWFFGRENSRIDLSATMLPLIAGLYHGDQRQLLLDDSFGELQVGEDRCGFSVKAEEIEIYLIEGVFYLGNRSSRVSIVRSDNFRDGFICRELEDTWRTLADGYGRPLRISGDETVIDKVLYHSFRLQFEGDDNGPFDTVIERNSKRK